MRRHINVVGLLFMLWGGMTLLVSLSLLSTGVAATAIGAADPASATGGKLAAGMVAAGFFILALLGFLFGWVHVWVGSRLRRSREWARTVGIILAILDMILLPIGTALGIYTLWALLHSGTRELFEG